MKFLREPLVHFLALGALLFGAFAIFGGPTVTTPGQYQIIITPGLMENLRVSFVRSTQRPPTPREMDALLQDYLREEILCREAEALGLDKDDPLVRRQLRQKMEFFIEDSTDIPAPTDDELSAYLKQNPAMFRKTDGTVPPLAAIHDTVESAWLATRRQQAADAAYDKLRQRYHVVIEPPAPPASATGNTTTTPP
jgi:hypothetical protein